MSQHHPGSLRSLAYRRLAHRARPVVFRGLLNRCLRGGRGELFAAWRVIPLVVRLDEDLARVRNGRPIARRGGRVVAVMRRQPPPFGLCLLHCTYVAARLPYERASGLVEPLIAGDRDDERRSRGRTT